MKTKLKVFLSAALCAVGLSATADGIPYLDWDDVEKKLTNAVCTVFETYTGQTTLDAGKTYVVTGGVSVASRITVNGTEANPTRLILCDGAKLTAQGGVKVTVSGATTNALVICGQVNGTGALEATGGSRTAGIGALSSDTQPAGSESGIGGTVTINGGTVTATGGICAAGIGGGWGGAGGTVTINGGTVTATGGRCGAGIGGGWKKPGGTVTINGGTVTATAFEDSEEAPSVAIGGCPKVEDISTVTFGAGFTGGIAAGADAASAVYMTPAAFSANHSAKYVTMPVVALKIPAATGYTYVVSNDTAEISGDLADGTNTYAVVAGATVKVHFTLGAGYAWQGAFENPKTIVNIAGDTVVDADELPKVLATMGVDVFPAEKFYDDEPTNVTWAVTNYLGETISDATISLREKGTDVWISADEFVQYVDVTNATVEVLAEKAGFTTASNEATVVISPRAVTLTSGSESFAYNGQAHSNLTVTVSGSGFVAGQGVATNGFATITDVSTKPNAFSYEFLGGTKEENYSVSCVTGTLTVTAATISSEKDPDKTWPAAGVDPENPLNVADPAIPFSGFDTTNVYDGVAHTIDTNALETAYTAEMFLGNAPSFSYALSSNGTYEATAPAFTDVTVTSVWYKVHAANFEDVVHPAKVIITNRAVTITFTAADKVFDGTAAATCTATNFANVVTGEGFALDTSAMRFAFADANVGEGKAVTATGCADGQVVALGETKKSNYTFAFVNTATASITPQSADGISMQDVGPFTYSGSGFEPTPGVTNETLGVMLDSGTDFDYGWESNTNAGTAKVIATLKGNYVGAVTNEFTINKASATIASGTKSWTYDAKPHAYTNLTVSGFVTGEGLATTSDWATITIEGVKDNAFSFTLRTGTLESNYALTVTTGKISVVKATIDPAKDPDKTWPTAGVDPKDPAAVADPTIPFSGFDTTNVYDGVAHTIDTNALVAAYTEDVFLGNAPSFSYALSSNGTYEAKAPAFTDVTVTSVWYKVHAANFEDVIHPAKVIITNRCVTLTSADAWWPYDGQTHSEETVTADGFVEGEGVTTNGFATITNVGSVPNAFSYEFLDGTKAENYSVTCVTGTLTIVGYTVKYNGSGADGESATGEMPDEIFGSTVETNLTRCAFTLTNFVFAGWTTNGVDKVYDDEQRGTDFVQSGETLSLTALWTRVAVPLTVTNLANTTVTVWTNDVELAAENVNTNEFGDGTSVYLAQTNANVTVVYRAVAGYMFDSAGTNGTVVIENLTYGENDRVPDDALPTVKPLVEELAEGTNYKVEGGNVVITSFPETADGVVTLPESIGGKPVIAIADGAFDGASWLKELDCSAATSLKSIGSAAFRYCTSLRKVTLPPNLTTVGANAFDMCGSLTDLVLPDTLATVGSNAFVRCYSLANVVFNGNPPAVNGGATPNYSMFYGVNGFTLKVPTTEGWTDDKVKLFFSGVKTWQEIENLGGGVWKCVMDETIVTPVIAKLFVTPGASGVTVTNPIEGLFYRVDVCTDLASGVWTSGTPHECTLAEATAKTLELSCPEASGETKFFRVTVSEE